MDTKFKVQYELLGNKVWLEEQYTQKKLSLNQIAKIVGCTYLGVRSAMVRRGISLRTRGEGLRNAKRGGEDYFVFNKSAIEGDLLGDGGLQCQNKLSSDSWPSFHQGTIHYDHAMWLAKQMFQQFPENRVKERANKGGLSPNGSIFRITSMTHAELVPLFKDWYPVSNDYKKIIPRSLQLDAVVLLHWFLGDGYSYYVRPRKCRPHIRVQFATQSFSKEDLDFLCGEVREKLGLTMTPRFHQKYGKFSGSGYFVELSNRKEQVEKFYSTIGPCPVASMAYKFKQL